VELVKAVVLSLACATTVFAQADIDVPFVVTPDHVTRAMLELAEVKPGDFVIDLGSGDGRIVIVAAKQFGARGLGVEIVPELVEKSRENAKKAGVADRVEFRLQDLFATDLSQATVITMYLLPDVNLLLKPRLLKLEPGTRIVSHDWDMGDWKPDRVVVIDVPDKQLGRDKKSRVYLWTIPPR
jgi:SAM-dependent methyltransferase